MRITLTANTSGATAMLARVEKALAADLSTGPMATGFADAGQIYLASQRERFQTENQGQWKQLAQSTRDQRQYLGFAAAHPILRRLGYLYRGLIPGQPGNLFRHLPDGIIMGYGGDSTHPGYTMPSGKTTGGDVRISDIAKFHHRGTGKMARRTILHWPDANTIRRMRSALTAAVRRVLEQTTKKAA